MDASLSPARRDELVERLARQLSDWRMKAPAILLLQMHAPLAFLGGQLLFAAQPLVAWMAGDRLVRDLAFLLEDPGNVERLIARLEE